MKDSDIKKYMTKQKPLPAPKPQKFKGGPFAGQAAPMQTMGTFSFKVSGWTKGRYNSANEWTED